MVEVSDVHPMGLFMRYPDACMPGIGGIPKQEEPGMCEDACNLTTSPGHMLATCIRV
ncbi:MAG: hypothetical protein V3S51_02285 [Dehalococcoidia bacterium]